MSRRKWWLGDFWANAMSTKSPRSEPMVSDREGWEVREHEVNGVSRMGPSITSPRVPWVGGH